MVNFIQGDTPKVLPVADTYSWSSGLYNRAHARVRKNMLGESVLNHKKLVAGVNKKAAKAK